MTREQIFEITRHFFGQALRVDARHTRLSLKSAGTNFHRAVVTVEFGARHFEVEISRPDNRIKLVEITTHKKFRFDHRNPINGFALKEQRSERLIRNHSLKDYLPTEKGE